MSSLLLSGLAIGAFLGLIYSLLYISFDATWKKVLSYIFGTGGASGVISILFAGFGIDSGESRMWFVFVILLAFIIVFLSSLVVIAHIITDKDATDSLRMRDILLGQKAYIDKYYEARRREIDGKLNVRELESREAKIANEEENLERQKRALEEEGRRLAEENERLRSLEGTQLVITLPDRKNVVLGRDFVATIPSYVSDLTSAYAAFRQATGEVVSRDAIDYQGLKAYLLQLCAYIMDYLFPGEEVRVHFRCYNFESGKYELLCALTGKAKRPEHHLTPIPYRSTMVEKSFSCKRAVLKSINPESDYRTTHHTKWKDYLTLTFWTLMRKGMPIVTMGISVKSPQRYRNLLYFLEFAEFDIFLNDCLEEVNSRFDVAATLYGGDK